tara:strand:- start:2110 stop:2250 length:141 start_codon:yes stop_codon:yes gene_type:complete
LSDEALTDIKGIQLADAEIADLNKKLTLVYTARNAYVQQLKTKLPV